MIGTLLDASKADTGLTRLLDEAREYAAVYLMARERQKGCDGLGELSTMKEEFEGVVDKVIQYCKYKKYISEDITWDVDSTAEEIARL
jgi:hypothetical protein